MTKYFRYCLCVLSLPVLLFGYFKVDYNLMLISVLMMFGNNLVFGFEKVKRRVFFLMFNLVVSVFLISRPLISMFQGTIWWNFKKSDIDFAIISLYVTLMFLFIGALITDRFVVVRSEYISKCIWKKPSDEFIKKLRIVSALIFYFALLSELLLTIEKINFLHGKSYMEYYQEFETHMPLVVRGFSGFVLPALCIFLSTKPKKEVAFMPLALYFLDGIPTLMTGARNAIVLRAIFVVLYYFSRDYVVKFKVPIKGNIKKWLGRLEITAIVVCVPAAIVFLGIYNYIRDRLTVSGGGIGFFIMDFFYKQGISFDVLAIGHSSIPDLPNIVHKCYTFGPIIDGIIHSTIAVTLFGAVNLEPGTVAKAIYGNSFADSMAYTVMKDRFKEGYGYGSSYILDTFADFGWIGVAVSSILIGMLCILFYKWIRSESWFLSTISLMMISSLYFLPRAEAMSFLTFLITPHFWGVVILCTIFAKLLGYKPKLIIFNKCCNLLKRSVKG